nr:reverse transcriptase domain-containing protein [Tanacetum cinerariifolium]
MFSRVRAAVPSTYHSLHPSGTPPLLPIHLPVPSTSRRAEIPEADMPPQKRLLLTAPRPGCKKDRAAVRAEIKVLRRERLAYEQEMLETQAHRHEWQRQTADDLAVQHIMCTQALEAGFRAVSFKVSLSSTLIATVSLLIIVVVAVVTADDLAVQHIMCTQALEAGDEDIDIEGDEEEDEYLAPADSTTVALPTIDYAPSVEETELFKTDESTTTPPPHPAYRIPSPPLPLLSPPPTDPTYEEAPLGYRAARLRWRAEREEIPEADMPLRKRSHIVDCTDHRGGVNQRVTELSTTFDRETSMIYAMIEERQDDQALQRARVNRLFRDRRFHAHTARLIEGEARASRTAWTQSMDASDAAPDRRFQTTVGTQQEEIKKLRAAHRKLQAQFIRALTALKLCQTQLTVALGHIQILKTARTQLTVALGHIQILKTARVPSQPEGVARALATRDAGRNTNDDDIHNSRTCARRTERWFKKMETVFRISNCYMENQIKFSTCTFLGSALTWWNSHVMTVGPDATYAMTWVDIKKKMTDKYCPRGEMKKLKSELWNLKIKSNDIGSYNQRFQELALLCVRMFLEEADKIE